MIAYGEFVVLLGCNACIHETDKGLLTNLCRPCWFSRYGDILLGYICKVLAAANIDTY